METTFTEVHEFDSYVRKICELLYFIVSILLPQSHMHLFLKPKSFSKKPFSFNNQKSNQIKIFTSHSLSLGYPKKSIKTKLN
jgi:hypothetical protein